MKLSNEIILFQLNNPACERLDNDRREFIKTLPFVYKELEKQFKNEHVLAQLCSDLLNGVCLREYFPYYEYYNKVKGLVTEYKVDNNNDYIKLNTIGTMRKMKILDFQASVEAESKIRAK